MEITSPKNSKIKGLIKLQQKSRERKLSGTFVVEGKQENKLALQNGFNPKQFYIQSDIFSNAFELPQTETFDVTQEIFDKIAYRSTTGGIVGIYETKSYELETLRSLKNPLLVVLEAVEKPGNLGAILRTCDAAKVDAVIVCDPKVDFYNPNVIRSSVGTVFTTKLISCSQSEFITYAKTNNIQVLATYLREDTKPLYKQDLTQSTALVFGTEATGLSNQWAIDADKTIKIPMLGQVDSLNVSNAVAVCVYESVRQRNL